jgi:putative ABC transport system permease protein
MVSSGGDPMLFLSLKDAQAAQFQKDSDAIVRQRARTAANPQLNPPGNPAVAQAVNAVQSGNTNVNAILVTITPDANPDEVAAAIRRWQRLTVYTRAEMEEILGPEADRQLGPANRNVSGHSVDCQRRYRGLHHLHHDHRQDP